MPINAELAIDFLLAYAKHYRESYALATTSPPEGPGYPKLPCSPFLDAATLDMYIAEDGVVINHIGVEPNYQWFIAGGPALKVDYEPTRTPPEITRFLQEKGILGKPIGIYRIVAKNPMRQSIWAGQIQGISREIKTTAVELGITICAREVKTPLSDVINSLSFGAYGHILDIHLPTPTSPIGHPHLIKNFGVFTADLIGRRFFTHLEIHGQADELAWDKRLVPLRVQHDLRRDLASTLSDPMGERGGSMSFGGGPDWLTAYADRLENLRAAVAALSAALQERGDDVESVFHNVINAHPLLLDVYGTCESKPQFTYPNGHASPIGKSSLEPDFLIKYSDCSYKLVEIERPTKRVVTSQGQPRAEVSQAVFQCAEWRHFIKTHYQTLSTRYPEIQSRCRTAVIMSRSNQLSFKNIESISAYKGLMMEQFRIDEFFTYDDLYDRAKTAYDLLSGLRPSTT